MDWKVNCVQWWLLDLFAGGSYLNKVELQNGCLALGHSNIYIPSTIHGTNFANGEVDEVKLHQNLEAAISVYTSQVNGVPCGGKPIHLTRGSTDELSKKQQERRGRLLLFLRGTNKKKKQLENEHPDEYKYFMTVWDVRSNHMVKYLPENYIFMLVPCYKPDCVHPVCRKGRPEKEETWFDGGPPISFVPLPIPDPKKPVGAYCKNASKIVLAIICHPNNSMSGQRNTERIVLLNPLAKFWRNLQRPMQQLCKLM